MTATPPSFSRLDDTGLIVVGGADARAFLHAQLSQDIAKLAPDRAPLAAWHDARGRVRALFRVVPADDGWLLTVAADLVEPTLAELRRFVLRSKVTLARAAGLEAGALVGETRAWLDDAGIALGEAPGAHCVAAGIHWIRLGTGLVEVIGPGEALRDTLDSLTAADASAAALAAIRLGLPRVTAAQSGRYVAQMLNLDTLGAIAFDKGCYPGQEVITRAHNLGTVKRRLRHFALDSAELPPPGSAVLDSAGETVGEVNRAAAAEHGMELLAVVRLERLDAPVFVAGRPEAPLREIEGVRGQFT